VGSEVKSLRAGRMSLDEGYGGVDGERGLAASAATSPNTKKANQLNHQPKRPRKLLLHRREIRKFAGLAFEKGLTLVPLKMYFKNGRVKVLSGRRPRPQGCTTSGEKLKADTVRGVISNPPSAGGAAEGDKFNGPGGSGGT
jgi:hypothetical protein